GAPVSASPPAAAQRPFSLSAVPAARREHGWRPPAYPFPADRQDLSVLRIVVRNGFTHDLADLLLHDLRNSLPRLARQPAAQHDQTSASFSHGAGTAPTRSHTTS